MQIPNNWLDYGIGALIALAVAKFMGWLQLPSPLNSKGLPPAIPPSLPILQPAPRHEAANNTSMPQQSYTTVIDIPHRITITPESK